MEQSYGLVLIDNMPIPQIAQQIKDIGPDIPSWQEIWGEADYRSARRYAGARAMNEELLRLK